MLALINLDTPNHLFRFKIITLMNPILEKERRNIVFLSHRWWIIHYFKNTDGALQW